MIPRLVVIVGPTAAGKTTLALTLAEAAGAEIISADSQQVYTGMDIGTGKATPAERARARHHLVDVAAPDELMTAARFAILADQVIAEATASGRPIIIAGGTGLYVRALLYGLFDGPSANDALRARLEAEEDATPGSLHARLAIVDPEAAVRLAPPDRRRVIRALEVFELTGKTMSAHQREHDVRRIPPRYPVRVVGLDPPRPELHARIDDRVLGMLAAGWLDEVRALAGRHPPTLRAFSAIGYRELFDHLAAGAPEDGLAEVALAIQRATRRYARRQLSWFRAEPRVTWYTSGADVDISGLTDWLRGAVGGGADAKDPGERTD